MSALRRAALGLLLGAAALLTSPAGAHAAGLPRPAAPPDLLTVSYDDGAGHPQTYALTCDDSAIVDSAPAAPGTDSTTDTATDTGAPTTPCARLADLGGPLPAIPPDQICSMLYGGPQTATVRGIWHGRVVDETYRRTNGCEVARWARMTPALPDPASAAPSPTEAVTYATPGPYNP